MCLCVFLLCRCVCVCLSRCVCVCVCVLLLFLRACVGAGAHASKQGSAGWRSLPVAAGHPLGHSGVKGPPARRTEIAGEAGTGVFRALFFTHFLSDALFLFPRLSLSVCLSHATPFPLVCLSLSLPISLPLFRPPCSVSGYSLLSRCRNVSGCIGC